MVLAEKFLLDFRRKWKGVFRNLTIGFAARYGIPLLLCVCVGVVFSVLIIHRHVNFEYVDWDMAHNNQGLWNLSHGRLYSSLYGFNFFGDHANFIDIAALPLFMAFRHPLTMTFVHVFLYLCSALIYYRIAQEKVGRSVATLLMGVYLTCPAMVAAILHEHVPELLSPFFLMLIWLFYSRRQWIRFCLTAIFLCSIKESMPLIVMMFGVLGLLARDRDRFRWGAVPFLFGMTAFLVLSFEVVPYFRGIEGHPLWSSRYGYLGSNPWEIMVNLGNVRRMLSIHGNPLNGYFLKNLFGLSFFPLLLSPVAFLPALPIVGYHLLSVSPEDKFVIAFFYGVTIVPFLMIAVMNALTRIRHQSFRIAVCFLLIAGNLTHLYFVRNELSWKVGLVPLAPGVSRVEKKRLLDQIPRNAGVIATCEFLPALSLREHLFSFHKVYFKEFQEPKNYPNAMHYNGHPFVIPENVEFALINWMNSWLRFRFNQSPEYVSSRVSDFKKSWAEIDRAGPIALYRRVQAPRGP